MSPGADRDGHAKAFIAVALAGPLAEQIFADVPHKDVGGREDTVLIEEMRLLLAPDPDDALVMELRDRVSAALRRERVAVEALANELTRVYELEGAAAVALIEPLLSQDPFV